MIELLSNNQTLTWIIILTGLWTLPWKGVALWKSARNGEKVWFIALLIVNSLAVLEILYIFFFSKKAKKIDKKIKEE